MTVAANQTSAQRSQVPAPPQVKYWTKEEYNRLAELGAFGEDDHFYLFRGELIQMSPMLHPHAMSIMKVTKVLFSLFDATQYDIRVQLPFDVPGDSMPEPDLLVCDVHSGRRHPHPASAALVVEIADSSLEHDRNKALEYAGAGVREYWIVDLNDRCVEIYRDAVPDRTALFGLRYPSPQVVKETGQITLLAKPSATVKVSELLP